MKLLSLDCSAGGCAIAVVRAGEALALLSETMDRGQDSRLIPLVQEAMEKAGLAYADLDRIAVTRGPGSFTGLRIGLAAARALGLAAEKPVVGIDRFAVFRAQFADLDTPLLVVLDSRREELFTRLYPSRLTGEEPRALTLGEVLALVENHPDLRIAGDLLPLFEKQGLVARCLPAPEAEVLTAARLAALANPDDPASAAVPLYLRAPDVTMPKKMPKVGAEDGGAHDV